MKITREISNIYEFEAWSGAVYTRNTIIKNYKQDDFMFMLEDISQMAVPKPDLTISYGLMMNTYYQL